MGKAVTVSKQNVGVLKQVRVLVDLRCVGAFGGLVQWRCVGAYAPSQVVRPAHTHLEHLECSHQPHAD